MSDITDMPVVNGIIDTALKIYKTSEDIIDKLKQIFKNDNTDQSEEIYKYFSQNAVRYVKEDSDKYSNYLIDDAQFTLTDEPLFNDVFIEREYNGFKEKNIFTNDIHGEYFFTKPILSVPDYLKINSGLKDLYTIAQCLNYATNETSFLSVKNEYEKQLSMAVSSSGWKGDGFKTAIFNKVCNDKQLLPDTIITGLSNNRTPYTYSFLDIDNSWKSDTDVLQVASMGLNNTLFLLDHEAFKKYELSILEKYLKKVVLEDIEVYESNLNYSLDDIKNLLNVSIKYSTMNTFKGIGELIEGGKYTNTINDVKSNLDDAKNKLDLVINAKKAIYLDEFEINGGIIDPEVFNSANRVYRAYRLFLEQEFDGINKDSYDLNNIQVAIDLGLLFKDLEIDESNNNLSLLDQNSSTLDTIVNIIIPNLVSDIALFKERYGILAEKLKNSGFINCKYITK